MAATGISPASMASSASLSACTSQCSSSPMDMGKSGLGGSTLEDERRILTWTHDNAIALLESTLENFQRERVLNHALNRPLERPRTEGRIVAFLGDALPCVRRDLEGQL